MSPPQPVNWSHVCCHRYLCLATCYLAKTHLLLFVVVAVVTRDPPNMDIRGTSENNLE
jgi:hypothetical protein